MAKTKFDLTKEKSSPSSPFFMHRTDQFSWYRDALSRMKKTQEGETKHLDEADVDKRYEIKSAIRFNLPHPLNRQRSHLFVVGNGEGSVEIYLARFRQDIKADESAILTQTPLLFRLFYTDISPSTMKFDFPQKPQKKVRLGEIFTTDIDPFLFADYPSNCSRVYRILTGYGDNALVVNATNRDAAKEEGMLIDYEHEHGTKEITHLTPQMEWLPNNFRDRISTTKFTFPATDNI